MDVKRLDLLRELAERGTVGAVADAMHVTPSAVSQQLKVLEKEAGYTLIEPAGRGVTLTVAGRALAQTATDIAVAIERAEGQWREFMKRPAGKVKVARIARVTALPLRAANACITATAMRAQSANFKSASANPPNVMFIAPLTIVTVINR